MNSISIILTIVVSQNIQNWLHHRDLIFPLSLLSEKGNYISIGYTFYARMTMMHGGIEQLE